MSETLVYDRRTILLHWLTAAVVAAMWGLGELGDRLALHERMYPRSLHILLGLALLVMFVTRLVWRNTQGRRLPPADHGWLNLLAKSSHYALYLLVGTTLAVGVAYEAIRADSIFLLFRLPSIDPGDLATRRFIGFCHETLGNAVMLLAGLHALAALFHHYVMRDGLLRRMRPTL